MNGNSIRPAGLAVRLCVYFALIIGVLLSLATFAPWAQTFLPIGGHELDLPGTAREVFGSLPESLEDAPTAADARMYAALFLVASLSGTIILMIPITWVYMATKSHEGYRKAFVAALIVLPICATSIVLLIQDSLALAFGLAALVAAVRFRVRLRDALDGIYVFAAICVGLASGVGYLGVAVVMAIFFCFASVVIWGLDYGANPIEEAEQSKRLAKLNQQDMDTRSK